MLELKKYSLCALCASENQALRKSSLTGPEIFVVILSHEKEEDSVKN